MRAKVTDNLPEVVDNRGATLLVITPDRSDGRPVYVDGYLDPATARQRAQTIAEFGVEPSSGLRVTEVILVATTDSLEDDRVVFPPRTRVF